MTGKPTSNAERMFQVLNTLDYPFTCPDGRCIRHVLLLEEEDICRAKVYTPDEVARLREQFTSKVVYNLCGHLGVSYAKCSASEALYRTSRRACLPEDVDTLVLNFASSLNPGGRVRSGGSGQEESLCEDSTLLASLESEAAAEFYRIQAACPSPLHTDAMILSPCVEFFAVDGALLDSSRVAAVLSAVPPHDNGDRAALEEALYQRIRGMLFIAAKEGYKRLILGAWGCESGGSDPELVASVFERALRDNVKVTTPEGQERRCSWKDFIRSITMAVPEGKNSPAFEQRFSDFHRAERKSRHKRIRDEIAETRKNHLSAIKGSLVGGAIGDALGYPVEFMSLKSITNKYGEGGIRSYEKDFESDLALISDDTQMTLFTANGMLVGDTRMALRGIAGSPEGYIHRAYRDWYVCQCGTNMLRSDHSRLGHGHKFTALLSALPEMYERRAPGNTCLNALHSNVYGTIEKPINNSKGCGGIMRIAPIPLYYRSNTPHSHELMIDMCFTAAKVAALTHGHPLGYMPAAALAHIISRAAFGGCGYADGLRGILKECREIMTEMFEKEPYLPDMLTLMDQAAELAANDRPDTENIEQLGGGWVAEETLAIAIYCCLRYPDDFSAAVIASVNHSGDSDSTGAVTGNIMGAWLGYEKIDPAWLNGLELRTVIEEVATDLCDHCRMSEYSDYSDEAWERKYIHFAK